ncbi:hypothetical protein N7G274_010145 [Stereocaulon virgatum]|uniref:Methyltransferase type 11 domain-containing protein n=1 Tax=Stereocaulon virgatum TaxID=373712 RepID=A0ABR3ZVF2_9LECA
MDHDFLLPATTYEMPPRLARKHVLNTIIEDENSEKEYYSEDDGEMSRRGRTTSIQAARSIESTSPVPSLTSSVSSYYKSRRQSEDFDEMYDVSDEDSDVAPSVMTSISTHSATSIGSPQSQKKQNRYPSLVIPSPRHWPTIQKVNTLSPPRPPKIPLSPAALSMLGHDLLTSSNPPSLTGSLNSGPRASSMASSPVTPDMPSKNGDVWEREAANQNRKFQRPELTVRIEDGSNWQHDVGFSPEDNISVRDFAIEVDRDYSDNSPVLGSDAGDSEVGVQLPPGALDTLRHLSLEIPTQPEFASPTDSEKEMEEVQWKMPTPPLRPSSADLTPMSQHSDYSISQLSIPSPGGFFSSLGGNARHTWCINGNGPMSAVPPSSTTAEQFYNAPWNKDPTTTVERIIEVEDTTDTEGPPTARQMPFISAEATLERATLENDVPLVEENDEGYEMALQEMAEKSLDRTSVWLAAQTSYMSALKDTYPANEVGLGTDRQLQRSSSHVRDDSLGSQMKKAVRFLESESAKRERISPRVPGEGETIYYHAFQHVKAEEKRIDAFRHARTRSDSIQTTRISLPHEHLAHLQGQFAITPVDRPNTHRPISMFPGKDSDVSEETAEQKVIARVDRERQALEQIQMGMWVIEATRYLSGGRLLNSPAATKSLKTAPLLSDIENGKVKNPPRVLDLGGHSSGDWAWHCSKEYQFARVYTASTECEQVESNIRGPRNHRPTAVESLWQLPYPDKYFNIISARSLFSFLKTEKPLGQSLDEYDLCLRECMRCLKPGGYLEFFVMDSEIVNAGSRGSAVSVEFGFNLKTRGYDPAPTKSWLGRVRRAGFDDIKRAWTFLPMGTPTKEQHQLPETPPPDVSTFERGSQKIEAVQGPVGSTADAASMSGLVGSWAWEQWMLRLQLETGKEQLLEGVGAVLEEGKYTGAGWRCLSGWARKPLDE